MSLGLSRSGSTEKETSRTSSASPDEAWIASCNRSSFAVITGQVSLQRVKMKLATQTFPRRSLEP
jgi:hypothetical protein